MAKKQRSKRIGRYIPQTDAIVSNDIFIPNHSGTHDAGQIQKTPTSDFDIPNKKYIDDGLNSINLNDLSGVSTSGETIGQVLRWGGIMTGWENHDIETGDLPTIDISSGTNLAVTSPIVLTDDTLSLATITTSHVETELKQDTKIFYIREPTNTDDFPVWFTHYAITIIKVWGQTDVGTYTFNLKERTTTSPGSGGANIMTSSIAADSNGENTTDFSNASIAADSWIVLDSSAVATSPNKVWIAIAYTIN